MSNRSGSARYYRLRGQGICVQCGERIPERGVRCDYCCLRKRYWASGSWRTAMERCTTNNAKKVLENEWKRCDAKAHRLKKEETWEH